MYQTDEPGEMAQEKRFQEIAGILAKGYLRFKRQGHTPGPTVSIESSKYLEKSTLFTKKGLDCPANQSVHVTTG